MRLGLYGGSFDPVHAGHVRPVRQAKETLALDRVLYLPTGRPPHKPGQRLAPVQARYTMVELALLEEVDFWVSRSEAREDKVSFTVETLERFRRSSEATLVLLVGSDEWVELTTWRRWERILEIAEIGVLERPGWERARVEAEAPAALKEAAGRARVRWAGNRPVMASASELRRCLAQGGTPPHGMLHPLVLDYIRKYGLYDKEPPLKGVGLDEAGSA